MLDITKPAQRLELMDVDRKKHLYKFPDVVQLWKNVIFMEHLHMWPPTWTNVDDEP